MKTLTDKAKTLDKKLLYRVDKKSVKFVALVDYSGSQTFLARPNSDFYEHLTTQASIIEVKLSANIS